MSIIVTAPSSSNTCTLGGIRTSLQARGYGSDSATAQNQIINDVYADVCGDHHWPWLEAQSTALSTVIGTFAYALSGISDLVHVLNVRLQSSTAATATVYDLAYRDPEEVESNLHLDRTNNIPEIWSIRNGNLLIYPRPSQALTIVVDYIKDPPPLVNDSDSPVSPFTYCPLYVYGAIAEIAARQRDWATHDRYRGRYETLLRRQKAQLGLRQAQSSRYVTRSGLYDDNFADYYGRP